MASTRAQRARRIPVRVAPSIVTHSRAAVRVVISLQKQAMVFVLALLLVLMQAQAFVAFEAHVVDVKAEIARLDPPAITPAGGLQDTIPREVHIDSADPDATHMFYTVTPGTDANIAPDPVCGAPSLGGAALSISLSIDDDAIIKAIACNGEGVDAQSSIIALAAYTFPEVYAGVYGHKYHDVNRSSSFEPGIDFPLEGWRMNLLFPDDTLATTTVTDASGFYYFKGVSEGVYTIKEESRVGWDHVTPRDFPLSVVNNTPYKFDFYNADTGYACVPKQVAFPAGLAVLAAGDETEGNDDIALATSVTIQGDARSNDDIRRIAVATGVSITGSATSSDDVDNGITVAKQILEHAPATVLPDVMIADWKARAAEGGTVAGSFVFPAGTTGITFGPTEISGNVSFGSANSATITGPVYIHGDLTLGAGTILTQGVSFADTFVPIVVDGTITVGSGASFDGSGSKGAFLLISTRPAVSGDGAALYALAGTGAVGDAVLYASRGDIHVGAGRTVLAAFAAHGTGSDGDDNAAVRIDANGVVAYRGLPEYISCGARQPYESTAHVVINEFVPNPEGADNAAKPGGEWVELFNPTAALMDVAGWVLYDNANTHALPITTLNTNTGGTTIPAGGYLVVYRDEDSDFGLNNTGGDAVRLFTKHIGSGGVLVDSHTYTADAPDGKSFARIPDGAANWIDPEPTPGGANLYFLVGLDGEQVFESVFHPAEKDTLMIGMVPDSESDLSATTPSVIALESEEDNTATSTPEDILEEESGHVKVEEPALVEESQDENSIAGNDDTIQEEVIAEEIAEEQEQIVQEEIAPAPLGDTSANADKTEEEITQ